MIETLYTAATVAAIAGTSSLIFITFFAGFFYGCTMLLDYHSSMLERVTGSFILVGLVTLFVFIAVLGATYAFPDVVDDFLPDYLSSVSTEDRTATTRRPAAAMCGSLDGGHLGKQWW